jgi:NAD(P)-dependent dehydrogenase (short-subunit alcohol dehydrogenase family)
MTTARSGPRRIVVTGANSGIGRALASELVAAGDLVIGMDRFLDTLPAGVLGVACDLSDANSTATAVDKVVEVATGTAGGSLDGLAAVAGVPGTAPVDIVLRVNLIGLRRCAELLLPHVGRGGSLVLVSSMAGYRGPAAPEQLSPLLALSDVELLDHVGRLGLDGPTAYQLSKQLVHRYALELAARLHERGIRCNSLSPGPVDTPILADFRATMPTLDLAATMVGRHALPQEIASVAAFLLSPAASWVNGVDLRLDGGLGALRAMTPNAAAIR